MEQTIIDIEKVDLLNKALDMKNAGFRLAQVCAVKRERIGLLYSFIKENQLQTLRFEIGDDETVESVGWLYAYAFLYENEMKDLFGVRVLNMNLDFGGHFYETKIKHPYNPAVNADG